jgi:AsmA protein
MKNILKYGLYGIGGIILLVLLIVAYFAITFNPNDYKDDIIKLVKEKKERTLQIDGDIKLSFWPKILAKFRYPNTNQTKNLPQWIALK